jgi:hypothetical protein
MGATVLNPGPSPAPELHLYAHCLRGTPGGVALLVINTDRAATQTLELSMAADRYTLTAQNLEDTRVRLNGSELKLGAEDAIPPFGGVSTAPGRLTFEPASVTFLGHDPEQIHELLKQLHSPKWHLGDKAIPTSTTKLDTIEFVEYTERCRIRANEFFGLNIPLPSEVAV